MAVRLHLHRWRGPAEQVNLATGSVTYLVMDSLGSVRGAVSSSGTLSGMTSYDAWGNPQTTGGLTATTPFGFAGGYTDADGLLYLMARYYDPSAGQFLSVDPMVSQTLQPYEYANGNPITNTDPTGKSVYRSCGCILHRQGLRWVAPSSLADLIQWCFMITSTPGPRVIARESIGFGWLKDDSAISKVSSAGTGPLCRAWAADFHRLRCCCHLRAFGTPGSRGSDSTSYRGIRWLRRLAYYFRGQYCALAPDGVTVHGVRRKAIRWSEVASIDVETVIYARTVVLVMTDQKRIRLPAPASLLDRRFDEKVQFIRETHARAVR